MSKDNYKEKKESIDNLSFFEVAGFSMWPFLKSGEKLVIKKVSIRDLRVGDIILYQENNQLVCHRLVKKIINKEKGLLYTRGDNSLNLPELVTEEMFLGKVIGVLKNNKLINFTTCKQRFINRLIVKIAPLVSWFARMIKPGYNKLIN